MRCVDGSDEVGPGGVGSRQGSKSPLAAGRAADVGSDGSTVPASGSDSGRT